MKFGFILGAIAVCTVLLLNFYFKTYTVIYDTKGGTIYASVQVKRGETAPKPADPVMQGFTFAGWYVDDKEYDFNKPINEKTTIVAKWEAD